MSCLLTWPTLTHRLHRLAETDPSFLQQKLHPEPPVGGFVKANRLIELFGSKYGGFQDSVKLSPREQQLDEVLDTLKPLLEKEMDESNRAAIRKALGPIQGEQHYSHYVPPTGKTLASGARPLLEAMIAALPKRHVVAIERETADALIEKYPAWWNKGIDMDSAIEVLPRKKLCLVRARNGRRVIITSSYFVAFTEDVSVNHR